MEAMDLGLTLASCAGAGVLFARCLERTVPGPAPWPCDEAEFSLTPVAPTHQAQEDSPEEAGAQVVVRLLGPVAVEVGGQEITSPSVVELVAYLVTHRQGVSDERLKTALWPERVVSGATFNNLVSLARGQLGRAADGSLNLPHAEGRRYRLGAGVVSDWELLTAATSAVAGSVPGALVDELEQVVLGVGGIPFESPRGFEWAHEEGLPGAASAEIGRAAVLLVKVLLEQGAEAQAEKVALAGLRACPGHELLERVWQRDSTH
ncbi:MAG TPA: hypothetical protein VM142_13495 [Acidimicrobiales bacterium]|nr:hypothetical protein [Acidimicrobiales bacterium]